MYRAHSANCCYLNVYSKVNMLHCFLQLTVHGRTGVTGVVTSAVVPEPEHEPARAQTLHLYMAVTIVKDRHKKRQSVFM